VSFRSRPPVRGVDAVEKNEVVAAGGFVVRVNHSTCGVARASLIFWFAEHQ